MRIIVTDTSCMIDLRKAALLESLFELPYTFVMPDILFEDEWLCLTPGEKAALRDRGLEVRELPGASVKRAARYFNEHRRLKLNDCFALALSEDIDDSILLTGDGVLRRVAVEKGVEVRGVFWIVDELEKHEIVAPRVLRFCNSSTTTTLSFFLRRSSSAAFGDWRSCCRSIDAGKKRYEEGTKVALNYVQGPLRRSRRNRERPSSRNGPESTNNRLPACREEQTHGTALASDTSRETH